MMAQTPLSASFSHDSALESTMNLLPFPDQKDRTRPLKLATTRPTPELVIVEARGEVDTNTSPMLHDELYAAVRPAPEALVVDLADIGFFGSSGITTLMELHRQCSTSGIQLRLVAPRSIHRILELVGLGSMFMLFATRTQAVAAAPAG